MMMGTYARLHVNEYTVLVADDGSPRICDFEMSKDLDAALSSTMAGGTRGFMAPEVVSGQSKPSPASDMFAFGVLVLNTGTFDNNKTPRASVLRLQMPMAIAQAAN